MMNRTALRAMLVEHEGLRLKPYRCPAGKLTIGVGRNLDDKGLSRDERFALGLDSGRRIEDGITRDEALYLLDNDITEVWQYLSTKHVGVFTALDTARQNVLLDMTFNLGQDGVRGFRKMWAALERRDFEEAAAQMRDSTWYHQVGDEPGQRGHKLALMMETGR